MNLEGQNVLIRNICPSDKPLVDLATSYGVGVYATSSIDDPKEIESVLQTYPDMKILFLPTPFQLNQSTKKVRLQNDKKIKSFMFQNKMVKVLRTARYLETSFLGLQITNRLPRLETIIPSLPIHWDKARYLKCLSDSGVLVPKVYAINPDHRQFPDLNEIRFPCICKPAYCSGGQGVFIAQNLNELEMFFSVEKATQNFSSLNLFYRNKTKGGLRNYLYNSGHFSGPYILQEFLAGRIVSVSGVITNGNVNNLFAYEIHSTENSYCAEQGFSWPIEGLDERALFQSCDRVTKVLKYPTGPFMIDFILSENGELFVIDAGPRSSLTGSLMSSFVFQNENHLRAQFLSHWNISFASDNPEGRPIFWQRFPFPKGKIKKIVYPQFGEPWVLHAETPLSENDPVFEARLDRQMVERGSLATTGPSYVDAKNNWQKKFQEIQWTIS
jgi:ATP-grasp domain